MSTVAFELIFQLLKENKEFSVYKNDDYTHMIYFSKEKQVVLSEKNRPALSTLSVFSYMVIFFLAFFLCMDLFGFSDRFWDETSIRNFFKGNTPINLLLSSTT